MDALLFAFNAIMPIVLMIALGFFLRKVRFLTDSFLELGNKLVFRVFIPCLLFYNIYGVESFEITDLNYLLFCIIAIIALFFLGILLTVMYRKKPAQRGVLLQCIFRSNYAIIGLPLSQALFGDKGLAAASMLTAVTVPMFNMLAVVALSIYDPQNQSENQAHDFGKRFLKILKGIITNPLIIACFLGIVALGIRALFVQWGITWRLQEVTLIYKPLGWIAGMASPFALLVLGGRFTFGDTKKLIKPILYGTLLRCFLVPAVVLTLAYFLVPGLEGQHFAAYVAAFGTPVAVSSAVMAQEMHGDGDLATQLVAWTSVASIFSLFILIVVLRSIGIL